MSDARETKGYVSFETTKTCPKCGKINSATNKYCVKCRTPLPDIVAPAWPPAPGRPVGRLSIPSSAPSIIDFLPQHSVSQTLRQIYFNLGLALSQQRECNKAAEAFQNALQATDKGDEQPQTYDILMHMGYAYEKGDNADLAFHSYVEATFHKPEQARPVFSHARTLLTPDIILLQGKWVIEECTPRIGDSGIPAATRSDIALLVASMHLYLANYDQAVEALKQAAQIAPADFPDAAADLLALDKLPSALTRYTLDSNASYILARLYQAIGSTEQAAIYIDNAFELLLSGSSTGKPSLDRGAYQLKAELLADAELRKADGKNDDAALRLYEAAQQYYFKSEFKLAMTLFREANRLNPEHLSTYWFLADCLRLLSQEYPDALQESSAIWDRGYAKVQRMDDDNAWAYLVHGLMYEQQSYLPGIQPWVVAWQAVCSAEQAMMYVAARTSTTYAYMGRFYRSVRMERNTLDATKKAVEMESENITALIERAVILANVGEFEEAQAACEKWRSLDENAAVDAIEGYIAWHRDQPDEGLALLGKAAKQFPNEIWYRAMRGYFYRLQGDLERAIEDCTWVWHKFEEKGKSDLENINRYLTSAYVLDKYEETLELLSKSPDLPGQDACSRYSLSGQCYLALGQLESGEQALNTSIALIINQRQIIDYLAELHDIERITEGKPYEEQMAALLARVKERLQQRGIELEKPLSAEDELLAIVKLAEQTAQSEPGADTPEKIDEAPQSEEERAVQADKSDGWAWIAAQAGLARIYVDQQRWVDAAKAYFGLYIMAKERFPEARMGVEMVCDHLLDEMSASLRANQMDTHFEEIMDALQHLLPLLQDDKSRIARAFTQVGCVAVVEANTKGTNPLDYLAPFDCLSPYLVAASQLYRAIFPESGEMEDNPINYLVPYFMAAFQLYRASNAAEPGKAVGNVWRTLFSDIDSYWGIDELFRSFAAMAQKFAEEKRTDEELYHDFMAAQEELSIYLDDYFQLKEQSVEPNILAPVVNPMALEIGLDLIPAIAWKSEKDWNLFSEYIPAMRQRLKNETGIEIPGVQVRDNIHLQPNEYAIYIDEVRVTQGKVPGGKPFSEDSTATDFPKMFYTPTSFSQLELSGLTRDTVVEAAQPLTGNPGYWVPADCVKALQNRGIEVWPDPFVYIVGQLERILRKNISNLLGMQEVRSQLALRKQSEKDEEFIRTRLLDTDASFHFTRLLQALVRESIPLTNLEEIIAAAQDLDLVHGNLNNILDAVRNNLKKQRAETQQTAVSVSEKEKTGGTQIGA